VKKSSVPLPDEVSTNPAMQLVISSLEFNLKVQDVNKKAPQESEAINNLIIMINQ